MLIYNWLRELTHYTCGGVFSSLPHITPILPRSALILRVQGIQKGILTSNYKRNVSYIDYHNSLVWRASNCPINVNRNRGLNYLLMHAKNQEPQQFCQEITRADGGAMDEGLSMQHPSQAHGSDVFSWEGLAQGTKYWNTVVQIWTL